MNELPAEPHTANPDPHPDWALLLPREVFFEIVVLLRAGLPSPVLNAPDEWVRRDRVAMAAVGALQPATAAEARLAAQFVAVDAWAMDCLRLAEAQRHEPKLLRRCLAEARSMMREGRSTLRVLLRMQAVRRAVAKDEPTATAAAWVEHAVVGMMAEALESAPAKPAKVVPAASAAGSIPIIGQHSSGEIDARKTRAETEPRSPLPLAQ